VDPEILMSFHEDWYSDDQARFLAVLGRFVLPLEGAVVEFGSWEGKSTCALANAVSPDVVIAVDTWQGNTDESPDHESVGIARERDVHETFIANIASLTKGNVMPVVQDCHEFMRDFSEPVKLCHIDACHDYQSVKRSIERVLPLVVSGGVLCGDDIVFANSSRADLDGGVERAVSESLPGYKSSGNLWYWVRPVVDARQQQPTANRS
jgi:predicted O-methyltransferase YrrM